MILCTGKKMVPNDNTLETVTKVVLQLMEPYLNKGYTLTVDNYYSPAELVDFLIMKKTDIYGTVHPKQKDMAPLKTKLKKGEVATFQ